MGKQFHKKYRKADTENHNSEETHSQEPLWEPEQE